MAKTTDSADFAEHEHTFGTFIGMLKVSIAALAVGVVALYFFIIAHNAWLGGLLLIAVVVGMVASALRKPRG